MMFNVVSSKVSYVYLSISVNLFIGPLSYDLLIDNTCQKTSYLEHLLVFIMPSCGGIGCYSTLKMYQC